MLKQKDAVVNIAVKDLGVAMHFYQDVLGLAKVGGDNDQVVTFQSGNTKIYVYRSDFAGSNKATTLTWAVGAELDDIVHELKSKGVTFEHYDFPGMNRKGDIHGDGDMRIAWIKDPDGNILAMATG